MTDQAPHPTPRPNGLGAVLLRLAAGLMILIAGLAVVLVLPMILVLNAMGDGANAGWTLYLWVGIVFLVSVCSVVAGLRIMDNPRPGNIALLAGIAIAAFFSFPPFWYAGP